MIHSEELKKDLSRRRTTRFAVNHAGHTLTGELNRDEFELMTADLLFRTESRLTRVLLDAALTWDKIDTVLAVGGSTRMPHVQQMLARITGKTPDLSLSPDEAVAHGAAIHAIMCLAEQANADSAINAMPGKIGQFVRTVRMTNVTAHSLGVVVTDPQGRKRVSRLLARNSPVPVSVKRDYGTLRNNQQNIRVEIVEGESALAAECLLVGTVTIDSLPLGLPRGSPVQVAFNYDRSGRLHVHALHVATGAWAEAYIRRRSAIDSDMIRQNQDLLKSLTIT